MIHRPAWAHRGVKKDGSSSLFQDANGAPSTFCPHLDRLRSEKIYANRSGEYMITDAQDNSTVMYVNQGECYPWKIKKIVRNDTWGNSTTQFDISNPSGTTFRYTYDTTGTDPGISATTVKVGTEVVVNGANFTAANNSTFTITGVGSNYFEVTNAAGVAESNKTLGAGSLIIRSAPQENYITIEF